jgi:dienelactone hydrolase
VAAPIPRMRPRGTTVSTVIRTSSATRPPEARNAKDAVRWLSRPGPHRVLRGDLGIKGIPGIVFAPEEGLGLPAVAFGHDWLQPASRYADLLRHLASWGFVTAAPGNHRGGLPSHAGFAADLRTTLEVCAGVRLGDGRISVDARRTALAGHGIGGGAARLAAVNAPRVAAVVTVAVAQTRPSALDAAREVTAPTLHLTAGKDTVAPPAGHAEPIAAAAGGPVWLRTLKTGQAHRFPGGCALERLRALRQPRRQDPQADQGPGHRVPDAPPAGRGPGRGAGERQGLGHHAGPPLTAHRPPPRPGQRGGSSAIRTPRWSSTR